MSFSLESWHVNVCQALLVHAEQESACQHKIKGITQNMFTDYGVLILNTVICSPKNYVD